MTRGRGLLIAALCLAVASLPACTRSTISSADAGCAVATVVPDSPRLRSWDNPFGGSCVTGLVLARVDGCGLGGARDRFQVKAGRVDMQLIFRDTQDTLTDSRLETRPVAFAFNAEAGRTYRIRGLAFYPPTGQRPADPTQYRIVFAAQDLGSGQIVQKLDVPVQNNFWVDTSTDLLTDVFNQE